MPRKAFLSAVLIGLAACCLYASPALPKPAAENGKAKAQEVQRHTKVDRSGKKQRGKASYYSRKFTGKKMASGSPMNPNANVAASKTLPLGTKARVKNLRTGKSTVVDVQDRGPYVKDRVIDLSPKAAKQVDMDKDGVAPVEVTPLQVPKADGSGESDATAAESMPGKKQSADPVQ